MKTPTYKLVIADNEISYQEIGNGADPMIAKGTLVTKYGLIPPNRIFINLVNEEDNFYIDLSKLDPTTGYNGGAPPASSTIMAAIKANTQASSLTDLLGNPVNPSTEDTLLLIKAKTDLLSTLYKGLHVVKVSDSLTRPNTTTQYATNDAVNIGIVVSGASNATPIEITTSAAHGLVTGEAVSLIGIGGNTAANGDWIITKTANDKFTIADINGVSAVGNGAYTSGGTVSKILTFANVVDANGGTGWVVKALMEINDKTVLNAQFRLRLYSTLSTTSGASAVVTAGVENATMSMKSANSARFEGYIDFTLETLDSSSDSARKLATIGNSGILPIPFTCDASLKSLYGTLEMKATTGYVPVANTIAKIYLWIEHEKA